MISGANEEQLELANARADILLLQQENQSLKKQLEEAQENIILLKASKPMLEYKKALEENQQKEFIEYLENEIKERNIQMAGYHPTTQLLIKQIIKTEKMVLSKYKEIIGDDK